MNIARRVLPWALYLLAISLVAFVVISGVHSDDHTARNLQDREESWNSRTTTTTSTTTTAVPTTTVPRPVATSPTFSTVVGTTTTTSTTTTTTIPLPTPPNFDEIEVDGEPFASLSIPRLTVFWQSEFGVDSLKIVRGDVAETAEFPMKEALDGGPAWQDSSQFADESNTLPAYDLALPGGTGTFVVAAHRGGSDQDGEFGLLHTIEDGDEITVETNWGTYVYRVTGDPTSVDDPKINLGPQLRLMNDDPVGNLLLFSCDEGTSLRTIVRAELVSVNGIEVR